MQNYKWRFIRWGTGLLSLYFDARLRKRRTHRPFDVVLLDALMRILLVRPELTPFSSQGRRQYESVVSQTVYWHGTGRLQHDRNGGTIDVFIQLLQQRGLRPFEDIFDVKQGVMVSTSVARQRMYARIYGDMHAYKGANLKQRYGRPRFWAYYFIMAINLHAIKELGLWNPKVRKKQQAIWREQGKTLWMVKVVKNKVSDSIGQFFDEGSDIPDNYPIIIGLKRANYTLLKTAGYVARYESRIGNPISMNAFSHLEVPASKIPEVTALLQRYGFGDLPVFAFEQCEQLYAEKHFSALVSSP